MITKARLGFVFACVALVFACFATGEDFVVVKKKKEPKCSRSKLQEQCCQEFAQQMKDCLQLHKELADLQELLLNQTIAYVEGDKEGIINKSDKNTLTMCLNEAKKCTERLQSLKNELENYKKHLVPVSKNKN